MNNENINYFDVEKSKNDNQIPSKQIIKKDKKGLYCTYTSITTSKYFLFFFAVLIVSIILLCIFSESDYYDAAISLSIITIILVIILELFISVLLLKTKALSIYYSDPDNKGLWILFLVGLFIIITAIVGAIMTISICKRIVSNNQTKPSQTPKKDD